MPPSMTFKDNRPGKLQLVLRGSEMSAEDVVNVPDEEPSNKGNEGYFPKVLVWPLTETKTWASLTNDCQRPHFTHDPAALCRVSLPKLRPKLMLHNIKAAEDGGCGDGGKCHLMEHWVFRIKIVNLGITVSFSFSLDEIEVHLQ